MKAHAGIWADLPRSRLETSQGELLQMRAGRAWLRYQRSTSLRLAHSGDRAMLAYVFHAPGDSGERESGRCGWFILLRCGDALVVQHPRPVEVLSIAYDGERDLDFQARVAGSPADPSIRRIAHEIRLGMCGDDQEPDAPYLEALAEALLLRAERVAGAAEHATVH